MSFGRRPAVSPDATSDVEIVDANELAPGPAWTFKCECDKPAPHMVGVEAVYTLAFFDPFGQLRYYERIMMPRCDNTNERMYHWVGYAAFMLDNRAELMAHYGSRDQLETALTAIFHQMHCDPAVRLDEPRTLSSPEFNEIRLRADARAAEVSTLLNWAHGSSARN